MTEKITLNNGVEMPRLGLGVYQTPPGKSTREAVLTALQAGYRHIDTAAAYRNERDVGLAIRESGIPRREVFVTTKLWTRDMGFESGLAAFDRSLAELGMDYVDLYLIHWPGSPVRWEAWQALEKIYADKKARAVGVSNYLERHLLEIEKRFEVVPAVNQFELSPFLSQKPLVAFCRNRKIQVEAYAPLTQGRKLGHATVVSVARKHARTPAQVLLRWGVEKEFVVIPKSVTPERIRENAAVFDFELDADDLTALDSLDEGFRTCWDPTTAR